MRPAEIRSLLASAVAVAVAAVAQAAPPASVAPASAVLSDACPAQLPVTQTVTGAIAGWTPQDQQGSYPFTRVAFYPGPPAESALIVPTVEYQAQAGLHDGWNLPRRPGGYWMTCAYANTTATLARKLADDADFCQADYDSRFMTLVVRHWSCGPRGLMGAQPRPLPRPAPRPSTPAQPTSQKPPVKRAG